MKLLTPSVLVLFLLVAASLAVFAWPEADTEALGGEAFRPDPAAATPASGPAPGNGVPAASVDHLHAPPLQSGGGTDQPVGRHPNSWFEATELDMGTFYQYESARGVFRFKNPGSEPRRFSNIRQSCNCTKSVFRVGDRTYSVEATADNPNTLFHTVMRDGVESQERIETISVGPGEEGEIEVHMEMSGTQGSKQANIHLAIDDPDLPAVTLRFHAFGAVYFNVSPQEVNLNRMAWNETREFDVQVTSPVFKDFEITGTDPLPPGMQLSYERTVREGETIYTIKGTYGPLSEGSGGGGRLVFHTDREELSFTVPVLAFVDGPLTVQPGFLAHGLIPEGKSSRKTALITASGGFDLQVEQLQAKDLSFDSEFLHLGSAKNEDGQIEVVVEVLPGIPSGSVVRGEVVVTLNHPGARTKSILFNGFVR